MITFAKEQLVSTEKFENVKIIVSITGNDDNIDLIRNEVNQILAEEVSQVRLGKTLPQKALDPSWKDTKDDELPF